MMLRGYRDATVGKSEIVEVEGDELAVRLESTP